MFSGKKLLILAGASVHCKVVKAAKEMGIYTIVTDYLEPSQSPAKLIADEYWMLDIMDIDGIVNKCKESQIDGVLNFCIDPAQRPYYELCQRLNLPCYTTEEQIKILTNKRAFKEYCISHNVDVIPEYSIKDIESDRVNYPVFVKPAINRGSRGQFVCYNKRDALKALRKSSHESADSNVICEKYMKNNQDIGSAFFVVNGEPYLVKFGDRFLGTEDDGLENLVMCTRLPSYFSDSFELKVISRVKDMIRSMKIQYGPVFLQGFVDGETVRYYDPAQRMPGGDYDLVLEKATGFSTVKSMICFALSGDISKCYGNPAGCYRLNGSTALLFTFASRPGLLSKIIGFDQLIEHPYVIYGRQIINEGEIVPFSQDIRQRIAAFGALIPSDVSIKDFVGYVYSTYHAYDYNNKEMIVSYVNQDLFQE